MYREAPQDNVGRHSAILQGAGGSAHTVAMNVWPALKDPLLGKVSLSRVFWVYGVLGSLACSALGLFIDIDNKFVDWTYTIVGLAFTLYVTVATYKCAGNCGSVFLARLVRISTLVSVFVIVPWFAYLYFSGALETILMAMPNG